MDPGKERVKRAKKSKVRAKPVLKKKKHKTLKKNKNIQNKATKSVLIIITLHNYGKFRQF
jgi:hypothetical protein